jgi:hypothetical protein
VGEDFRIDKVIIDNYPALLDRFDRAEREELRITRPRADQIYFAF